MQFNPWTRIIFYGILGALGVVGALTPALFPSFIPSTEAADIIKTAGLLTTIMSGIAAGMASVGSSKPGPLAPADPEIVAAATQLAAAKTVTEAAEAKKAVTAAMQNH